MLNRLIRVMTCITNKTIVLVAITVLLIPVAATYAEQDQIKTNNTASGSVGNTNTDELNPKHNATNTDMHHTLTQEQIDKRVDELIDKIGDLYFENHVLYEAISDDDILNKQTLDEITQNNQTIQTLRKELDILYPIPPDIHIPDEEITRMENAMLALTQTDLPLFAMGINHATGTLDMKIYKERAYLGVEKDIKEYTKDIPIVITYGKNTAKFQSSCDSSTGYCDPIIGGVKSEDKYPGVDCTISLAAKRTTGNNGTESGVIIPDHCNPQTTTYYQPNNDKEAYKIGEEFKDGGWFCDCDFVKSDLREIDENKIHTGSSDLALKGKADLKKGDMIHMYGGVSGSDDGIIVAINQWMQFKEHAIGSRICTR